MKLISFRIKNYRSIFDSGLITTEKLTAILGRNESGKTNLLSALYSLKPAEEFSALDKIKNFPRNRRLEECDNSTRVVESTWELTDSELVELGRIYPRAKNSKQVIVSRNYGNSRQVGFSIIEPFDYDANAIKKKISKVLLNIENAIDDNEYDGVDKETILIQFRNLISDISPADNEGVVSWAGKVGEKINELNKGFDKYDLVIKEDNEAFIDSMSELIVGVKNDDALSQKARDWVVKTMPVFIYVDEYPELEGHQNIGQYFERKRLSNQSKADVNFDKLCKVAGINPEQLHENKNDPEVRNQLANRAGAVVTQEIHRLWKDKPLKIRFNLDNDYFHTYVSDHNSGYDVEVNLDERSRGFKWFFSFYITFCADTHGGDAENAIILLDEPGLYLHAKSQGDLLNHLIDDFTNQIIYTTHSPFLVPVKDISAIKTVSISEEEGTQVTNDPSGDSTTLFPLQAALGYDIAQSLFIGSHNLIVEGVTDYWYISAVSEYLISKGMTGLNDNITITPAGGAQKVSYLISLLSSQNLNVVLLLDDERNSRQTSIEIVSRKLIGQKNIVFVSEVQSGDVTEVDIEDLFDKEMFRGLISEAYFPDLSDELNFNDKVPRITKQAEEALKLYKMKFVKAKPARLFLSKLKDANGDFLSLEVMRKFEALFKIINKRISSKK
ncbi:AAA family ATPase [Edwardsiella tarda]|uniref:AAA family ATPase n=1 Tax=Edwardsiella tarda TaxID=636 RepID=UPI000BE43403|nr:AAA family ATPase [Edwardsiella tarda]ATI64854.1 hypothetical protein CPU03_11655 [Edwardsiella tarda]